MIHLLFAKCGFDIYNLAKKLKKHSQYIRTLYIWRISCRLHKLLVPDFKTKHFLNLANKSYSPGGGNIEIFAEPLKKPKTKPKIDTGLIFEQVVVPIDSVVTTVRSQANMSISHSNTSSKLKPIAEISNNKIKDRILNEGRKWKMICVF